jgi:hydroxymethylpyrimidine pyrophosphatase-like HAD family hydrolase
MHNLSFRYGVHRSKTPGIDAAVSKIEAISPEKGGFVSDIDGTLLQRKEDLVKAARKKLSSRKFPGENVREAAVRILAEELDRRQVEKAVRLLSDQLAYTRVAIISGNDEEVQHERLIRPIFDHLRQLEDGAQRMRHFTFYVNGGATKKVNYRFEDGKLVMDTVTRNELEFGDESLRKLIDFLNALLPRVPDILGEIIAKNGDIPEGLRKEIAGNANAARALLQEWVKDKTLERITPADSGWTEGQPWEIRLGKDGSFMQTLPWIELRGTEGTPDAHPVQAAIKPLPRSFVYGAEPFLPENIDRDAFIREYRGGKSALPGLTPDRVKDMSQEGIARFLNELYAIHDLDKYLSLAAKHRLATVRPAEADERAQNKKLLAARLPGTLRNSGINEYTGTTIDIGDALRKRVKDEILKENFLDEHLLLSLGGSTSINIGSGKNSALQDFIDANDLDPAQIVYAGDRFSPEGNDYLVLQILGITIISVGPKTADPVIEARRAKGEFIQAGNSAGDLLEILKRVTAGRRNSEQPGRRSTGTGAVKQALQTVTPAAVLRGKALKKTVGGGASALVSRFAFRKEAYVIAASAYDETVVERARGLAEQGLQVLVSMPLEDGSAAGLVEAGGEASNADMGGQVARVWARQMQTAQGSLTVLYYKSVDEAVQVDSRRFGIAAVKLLYDNPQLRERLGLRKRAFKVGVFEMDDPLEHPAIVEGGLTGSEFLEDAVMVLDSGSGEVLREVPAGLEIDPRYVKEVNGRRFVDGKLAAKLFDVQLQGQDESDGVLRTVESAWKKKREVKYIKDIPLSSVTVDVAQQAGGLRGLVNERLLEQLNEAQIDTIVLKGLAWQLDENERQQLLAVIRKLHEAGKRVVVEYRVTQDADRASLLLAGRKAMKMGADGVRADMSNYRGNMLAAADDLKMLRRITLRADPDAIVAVILSEHTDFKGYGLFDAGIKRVVRYFPGQQISGVQPGTWLEVAEPYRFKGDEAALAGIFRKLVEDENAEMIGMDYELLNAAVLKAAPRTFAEVFGDIFMQWRRRAVNTPEFRYRQGYHAGWNVAEKHLPGNVDRFYAVLKAGTPDEFIERFNSVFAELPGTDKQAWEEVSDTVRQPAQDPETATLQWNEARGNVEGLMARVELSRYTNVDAPFTYRKDRELFGWLLVQAKLKGIVLPEDLKTMPLEARRAYYTSLNAQNTDTGDLKDVLARIHRLESRLANGATLGDTGGALREEMNELYGLIKEEKDKPPLAITELLKLIDLYADRDIKALHYLKRESLEALPAAVRAIQSAA